MRITRNTDGRLVATAGVGFAALWIAVIGGRMVLPYGADHWFGASIAPFPLPTRSPAPSESSSATSGGCRAAEPCDAWTAAFVLMALTMVLSRVAVTAVVANRTRRLTVQALSAVAA